MATITSPLMILIRFMMIDSKVYFAEIQSIEHFTVIVRPGCEGSLKKRAFTGSFVKKIRFFSRSVISVCG